jgi:hypothetical protein
MTNLPTFDLTAYPEVDAALTEYINALQAGFGAELAAVYALGSLSTANYIPGWSDVNGVIIARQGDPKLLRTRARVVRDAILEKHPEWNKLLFTNCILVETLKNVTWHTQPEGWGLIDLTNLIEDGLLLWGQELRDDLELPVLEEVRAYQVWDLVRVIEAAQVGLPLPWRAPKGSEWDYYRAYPLHTVDWLVYSTRVLLTWDKGRAGSKSEAVNHYIEEYHGPWEPVLLQADALRRTGSLESLTPDIQDLFVGQTPSLFEWMVKRLLGILLLPTDMAQAAANLRRWLERAAVVPLQTGLPYDTFLPGRLGERVKSDDPNAPDVFIPKRKPWLKK